MIGRMRRRAARIPIALVVGALIATMAGPAQAGPPPAPGNDHFHNAARINALPASRSADTTSATTQGEEPDTTCNNDSRSVWYQYRPSQAEVVRADTIGSADLDNYISVYRGSRLQDLIMVGCSYSYPDESMPARVAVRLKANTTYHFQVGSHSSTGGVVQFNLRRVTPPANDGIRNATWINHYPFTRTFSNINATSEPLTWYDGDDDECYDMMATVWFRTTPARDYVLRADTIDSPIDTMLAVYEGGSVNKLDRIACYDDTSPAATAVDASIAFRARKGHTYYFQVGGYDNETTNQLRFHLRTVNPPDHDQFANAETIGSLPYSDSTSTRNATRQGPEPSECGEAYQTVWYEYTPSSTRQLRATSSDRVGVYRGSSLGTIYEVACGSSTTEFEAIGGETYYFQVFHAGDDNGAIDFTLEDITPP